MRRRGKAWEGVLRYGEVWKGMGGCVKVWGGVERHGRVCQGKGDRVVSICSMACVSMACEWTGEAWRHGGRVGGSCAGHSEAEEQVRSVGNHSLWWTRPISNRRWAAGSPPRWGSSHSPKN